MPRSPPEPLSLTSALIAGCHPRPGNDDPSVVAEIPEHALRASLDAFVASLGPGASLWLFAYGSLLWHPEVDSSELRPATVKGFHRRFCLWQWRYRGTAEQPGLMLALDCGGACRGVVYRVDGPGLEDKLASVWRRELRGNGYRPRLVTATTPAGLVPAIAFVANRAGPRYAGRLPDERIARHIASANGAKGPSAEYLRRLALTLEGLGIRDRHIWNLQRLVSGHLAERAKDPSTG